MGSCGSELERDRRLVQSVWPEWQLMDALGSGQYGIVYKARRHSFAGDSFSAIKVVTIESTGRDNGLNIEQTDSYLASIAHNYTREIKMMEYVKGYSNIVNIEDYHVMKNDGGKPWHILIRMELLTPLYEYLETAEITDEVIIRIGRDLCGALEVCGAKKIVHRDIKPANVFVNSDGVFKLGDFGVARQILDYTSQTRTGTPDFMAPEVYHGTLRATDFERAQCADIYSLGMLLYWIANNRRMPFVRQDGLITADEISDAFARKMGGEQLPDPACASGRLKKVILKACSFDPAERYLSAGQFREALENTAPEKKAAGQGSRKSLIIRIAAVLLLVAMAAAVYWLVKGNTGDPPETEPTRSPVSDIQSKSDMLILPSTDEWSPMSETTTSAVNTVYIATESPAQTPGLTDNPPPVSPETPPEDSEENTSATVIEYRYRDSCTAYTSWSDWSEWSDTQQPASDLTEEESKTRYMWWAAKCSGCGTNNPYWGTNTKCHGCGKTLPSGEWKSARAYSDDTSGQTTLFGRSGGRYFDGSPYWLTGDTVTQYRYRTGTVTAEWGAWSDWSTTEPAAEDGREIESRTMEK